MTFWGACIVVTSDLISEVLHVPRVSHPNNPSCERLRTVSRDEFLSHFCEMPSIWGGMQNTPCLGFAKGPRFLNVVMTFTLTPLSHYNSITELYARFLLSLLEDLTINFPSHFITSIRIWWPMISSSFLQLSCTRILRHFSIFIPSSPYYTTVGAIDVGSVWRSKAQLRLKPTDPTASTVPSTSALSSSTGDVTLKAIMAQFQRMDACLDTLTNELCLVNTHVSHIARWQDRLGGFAVSPSLSPEVSADEDGDNGDEDKDEDAISSNDDEISFGMRVVLYLGGELA